MDKEEDAASAPVISEKILKVVYIIHKLPYVSHTSIVTSVINSSAVSAHTCCIYTHELYQSDGSHCSTHYSPVCLLLSLS